MARWPDEPLPELACVYLPGFSRASLMKSAMFLPGNSMLATSTLGPVASSEICAKSLLRYGMFW
ncbi:hypothetical protein D3C77_677720 [compost metagenome]